MNSNSEDDNQISIFDVDGVDQEDHSVAETFTWKVPDFEFDEWAKDITLDINTDYTFADYNDSELTVRNNGKKIKVGQKLCELEDKLDAIIAKVEMVEQELSKDNPKIKELPSIETLVEQKQLIDTLKRNNDDQ